MNSKYFISCSLIDSNVILLLYNFLPYLNLKLNKIINRRFDAKTKFIMPSSILISKMLINFIKLNFISMNDDVEIDEIDILNQLM
jgi:hypothetical protein